MSHDPPPPIVPYHKGWYMCIYKYIQYSANTVLQLNDLFQAESLNSLDDKSGFVFLNGDVKNIPSSDHHSSNCCQKFALQK